MELPKNITQIGEVGRDCKIYVEDYVVSYMKQLNRAAQDKDMAVALYGKHREENGVSYHFIYGACKLDFLQREARHLSQAQRQEIERYRKQYFRELGFVGYALLNGEMIEGFHICEQDICRYISGYAQFYEKNDLMLAYMLEVREAAEPERVDQEKYEEVKRRQEERRAASERPSRAARIQEESARGDEASEEPAQGQVREGTGRSARKREPSAGGATSVRGMATSANLQRMRLAAVGVFALLCLLGIATFRSDTAGDADDPTGMAVAANSGNVQKDTLVMEDKLEQVLLNENQSASGADGLEETGSAGRETEESSEGPQTPQTQPEASMEPTTQAPASQVAAEQASAGQPSADQVAAEQPSANQTPTEQVPKESEASQAMSGAVAYVIRSGDTLIAISKRQYGTDVRVADICNLNKITDPDDIKVGQVIMLPR
ncbi:MAG: LysM peptidoglycan-binding domain-containing protein [Acetatifactor muris]|nr:LysM peptidoglycan-binding domain-containing protein [Acetatifactor muris]